MSDRETIKYMMTIGIMHMQDLQREIGKMDIKNDGTESKEILEKFRMISLMLTALNDAMHVGFPIWVEMFPEHKPAVDHYIEMHKRAQLKKIIGTCTCPICDPKEPSHAK